MDVTTANAAAIRQIEAHAAAFEFESAKKILDEELAKNLRGQEQITVRRADADLQFWWGEWLRLRYRHRDSIPHLKSALETDQKWRSKMVGRDLVALGRATLSFDRAAALPLFESALSAARTANDRTNEVLALNYRGLTLRFLGVYSQAAEAHRAAIALAAAWGMPGGEATGFLGLGSVALETLEGQRSIEHFRAALGKARDALDVELESNALNALGAAHVVLQHISEATNYYMEAIICARRGHNRDAEGEAIGNLGLLMASRGESATGFWRLTNALAIRREVNDRRGEGALLGNVGETEIALGFYGDAQTHFLQSIEIARETADFAGEAKRHNHLGRLLHLLGSYDAAAREFEQALRIQRTRRIPGEHITLNNLGAVFLAQKDSTKAIDHFEQAVRLAKTLKDEVSELTAASNLGVAQRAAQRYFDALLTHSNALQIARRLNRLQNEATELNNIGVVQRLLDRLPEAVVSLEEALTISHQIGDSATEAGICNNLMVVWRLQGNSRLAIFYGKQAINGYQRIRQNVAVWNRDVQADFLESRSNAYEVLAELFIDAGRLAEAVQVLNLLKAEEYSELVRGSETGASQKELALSPGELDCKRLQDDTEAFKAGLEFRVLRDKPAEVLTPNDMQRKTVLRKLLDAHSDAFLKCRDEILSSGLPNKGEFSKSEALMADLANIGPGVAAIHTLMAENRFHLILTTPDTQTVISTNISKEELNRKLFVFHRVLQAPSVDPVPLARELYSCLFRQVVPFIETARVTNLIWCITGPLRYIPIAALHDGNGYLVERYQNSMITDESLARLKDSVSSRWSGVAFGLSKPIAGFSKLPGVVEELTGIVGTTNQPPVPGISGEMLLDEQFTEEAFFSALERPRQFVHIATHFSYTPDEPQKSFLLLGDTNRLTLRQLEQRLRLELQDCDLLTLSACDTASGGGGTNEIEAFAIIAQKKGAKAVLGSLWPVSDASTPALMQQFYSRRAAGGLTKGEALRQAQLALLRGEAQSTRTDLAMRGIRQDEPPLFNAQPFQNDPRRPFAHPFYWAPFILIGNWK